MANIGMGTAIFVGSDPSTAKKMGALTDISDVGASADTIEVTTYDSANGYREFIQGLKDGGDVTLTVVFDAAEQGQVDAIAAFESGEVQDLEIRLPTTAKNNIKFKSIITGVSQAFPMEEQITRAITLKITGKITFGTYTAP